MDRTPARREWILLLAIGAAGCRAAAPDQEAGEVETGVVDAADSAGDTGPGDTGEAEDSGPADTAEEADSGGDTDTGPVVPTYTEVDLEAEAGAKLVGEAQWSAESPLLAWGLAGAGDVDGDGHDDLLVGMPGDDGLARNGGATYIVRGPVYGNMSLSESHARIRGHEGYAESGTSVALAGDLDGDGVPDLVIGAPSLSGDDGGRAFVVSADVEGEVSLATAKAVLEGEYFPTDHYYPDWSYGGESVAAAGDVDGDGFDDVLVGAPNYYEPGVVHGVFYVARGPLAGTVDLADAHARILGDDDVGTYFGRHVASAGDIDGDGLADVLVTAQGYADGALLLYRGPSVGVLGPADADATFADEGAGGAPAPAGDVDGDGLPDLWIGMYRMDDGAIDDVGGAILVPGPIDGTFDRSVATATLLGTAEDEHAGLEIASVGDVDGDDRADLLVGAPDYDAPGAVYLACAPFAGTTSLANARVKFLGEGVDEIGSAVAGPGDVDGDGLSDLLILGPGDDSSGESTGAAWLVYGASLP